MKVGRALGLILVLLATHCGSHNKPPEADAAPTTVSYTMQFIEAGLLGISVRVHVSIVIDGKTLRSDISDANGVVTFRELPPLTEIVVEARDDDNKYGCYRYHLRTGDSDLVQKQAWPLRLTAQLDHLGQQLSAEQLDASLQPRDGIIDFEMGQGMIATLNPQQEGGATGPLYLTVLQFDLDAGATTSLGDGMFWNVPPGDDYRVTIAKDPQDASGPVTCSSAHVDNPSWRTAWTKTVQSLVSRVTVTAGCRSEIQWTCTTE